MYGDKDGAYPPRLPSGGQWGTRSGPTPGAVPPEQAAGLSSAWGQTPAWGNTARDTSSARWESPASPAGRAGPGGSAGGRRLPVFLRPPAVWFTGVAAVGSVVLVALAVLALLPPPTTHTRNAVLPPAQATNTPLPRPASTATPVPLPVFALPAFHDWRAAYLASDGKVHVVSLDGQTDLTGPTLTLATALSTNSLVAPAVGNDFTSLAVAPNGQYLAYIDQPDTGNVSYVPAGGDLVVTPLATGSAPGWGIQRIATQAPSGGPLPTTIGGWSPDSTTIAFSTSSPPNSGPDSHAGTVYTASAPTWQPKAIPGAEPPNSPLATAQILGWIDNTHLALLAAASNGAIFPPLPGGTATMGPVMTAATRAGPRTAVSVSGELALVAPLGPPHSPGNQADVVTVDVTTGAGYTIAQVPGGSAAGLSPDGTRVVAQYYCPDACPSSPLTTEVIETHTGAVHPLPNSDKVIAPTQTFAWNPQADVFAATVNTPSAPYWQVATVDAAHDTAGTLRTGAFALGWSPDGGDLLVGDAKVLNGGNGGTYNGDTAWLMTPRSADAPVALPQPVVAFIGWVRTA